MSKVLYETYDSDIDRLIAVIQSPSKIHKLRAIFESGEFTDFGAKGFEDFTSISDRKEALKRKALYLKRHKKNENWNDYKSAGSLSRYILWNKPTIKDSVEDYLNRFNMKKVKPIRK